MLVRQSSSELRRRVKCGQIGALFDGPGPPRSQFGLTKCSCPPSTTSPGIRRAHRRSSRARRSRCAIEDIRRFARKSIQKGAKFFLTSARTAFVPGSHRVLEEPLCIQIQRNTASKCFCGKLSLHLRIEFDADRHRSDQRNPLQFHYTYAEVFGDSRTRVGGPPYGDSRPGE